MLACVRFFRLQLRALRRLMFDKAGTIKQNGEKVALGKAGLKVAVCGIHQIMMPAPDACAFLSPPNWRQVGQKASLCRLFVCRALESLRFLAYSRRLPIDSFGVAEEKQINLPIDFY